ncbi:MAG: DUF4412 domain-containing protein [Fermentimonas sp.]|nr:DUF4412 domain-containing protein [Fermentimonas sp.]MDD3189617.1 DUF4412 domain-containing protein [Fermentimonas sp.]MDD3510436.1 DUF4412 domain-containing protein [Fermentimonas sp.]NLC86989.1 hypothetical protein [Bacteroidales bacterium]
MKTVKILTLIVVTFGFVNIANAQFLDRLKNRVLEKTEDVIVDKTAEKAAEQTAEAMDKILNPNIGGMFDFGGKAVDLSQLPELYHFDYNYTLKMVTESGDMHINYLFNKNEPYIGIKTEASPNTIIVFDNPKNIVIIKSDETILAREIKVEPMPNDESIDNSLKYKFTELPDREYLGYNCKGYQIENEEQKIMVYFAPDVNVKFGNTGGKGIANISKEMKSFIKKYENGLLMYMEMDDKLNKSKKNDESVSMECIAFEESATDVRIR